MTIKELYETFDDISEYTNFAVYDNRSIGRFVNYDDVFYGIFNDMPIDIRQYDVANFSYSSSQDVIFVTVKRFLKPC